jgi:dTDP-4-amino-4,6-dideoxygalactose transaminase
MLTTRQIPFFNYPALFANQEAEFMATVGDVLRRGAYIMQQDLFEFEKELAAYVGARHAIGVADGTMGLLLPLLTLGLRPKDEVIVSSHTFVASAAAIHHAGATPVLVDCGRDHMIEPNSIRNAITSRTRGIMPVQLNGRTADMDHIQAIAREHGLFIVEDSCQALGSRFKGRCAGTFGVAGSFSFYPSKTLGCFGDGGAVVTDDDQVTDQIRSLRDHGRGEGGMVTRWGFNSRLDNLQAALLRLKLRTYDAAIGRRRQLAAIYESRLRPFGQLLLPPAPDADPAHFDIYQNYEIEAFDRDALRSYLQERGVGTILQWGGKCLHQFRELGFTTTPPYTDAMTSRFMLLPLHAALEDDDVHYVCDCIGEFYEG